MKLQLVLVSLLGSLSLHGAEPLLLPDASETPRMQAWRELKYGMFLHFGMSTFTGNEFDPGEVPSTAYAPSEVDAVQWIRVAKEAGMKYAVLTSKHVAGHCLWDSKVTFRGKEFDYDVATSGNKMDVVRAFVDACKKHGIKPGLYYCLLDFRNNSVPQKEQWGKFLLPDDFYQLAKDQLAELVKLYPEVGYYWLDIPRAASADQRAVIYDMLRRANPDCVVLFNEGFLNKKRNLNQESTKGQSWPTDVLNSERDVIPEPFVPSQTWDGRTHFLGYEHCDVVGKHWFWIEGDKARPTEKLYELYDSTVNKAGGNLLLNVGPGRDGKLQDWQIEALMKLKQRIQQQP
jgi:alpha-L-fucosidase